jgi:hypothetical protein
VAIDAHRAAHDCAVGVELRAPQRIGEHNLVVLTVGAIRSIGIEEAAQLRLNTKQAKEPGGDLVNPEGARFAALSPQADLDKVEGRGIGDAARLLTHKLQLAVVDRVACRTEHGGRDKAQLRGLLHMRPGIEENGVGPRDHRRQRADAQRQRQHCRERKAGRLTQLPHRIAKILHNHDSTFRFLFRT